MDIPSSSTLVIVAVVFGLAFASTRRPWTATAVTIYILAVALLSSWIKQTHLGVALTLADVYFFLLRPVENFKLFLSYPSLGLTLIGALLGAALCIVLGMRFERPSLFLQKPRGRWRQAAIALAALLLVYSGYLIGAKDSQKNTEARVNDGDAYSAFLAMYEQQTVTNPIQRLNVFFNNRSIEATMPMMHSQSRFPLAENTATPSSQKNAAVSETEQKRPDIFLILEESTFDTTLIRSCHAPYCDNTMLHPLSAATRTQEGPLLVHTTGGGTWLSEFAVLSGLDWRAFGRGGAYAPVSIAPRLRASLPLQLRSLGYRTIGIYPTDGNFLSARAAYEHYGFEEFYDARDLKLPQEWGDISDAMMFDRALSILNRGNDTRPVFLFVLTIRNHGPHGGSTHKIPPAFTAAVKDTSIYLADYLARMRESSDGFTHLAKEWLSAPRPRVLAWFGDHQPEAAWDFTEHAELLDMKRVARNVSGEQLKYLTYYQFSANFGTPATETAHDAMDISYLGAELLTFAGVPLNAAELAARQVETACHGLMFDCPDRSMIDDYLSYRVYQLKALH